MSRDEREREEIRRAEDYLTEHFGVVVDDVVMQNWNTGRPDLVHERLAAAVADAGAIAAPGDLLPVAEHIAEPDRPMAAWAREPQTATSRPRQPSSVVAAARLLASELLTPLADQGRRWRHTRAVAARAEHAALLFAPEIADQLVAAAWLHDVGYAPELNRHGFHPVDGADHVDEHLTSSAVAGLIAHHSGSRFVAEVRGVRHLLDPYDDSAYWSGPLADALTWADQTTGPDGQPMTVERRLTEMLNRHGPDSPNARSNDRRAPAILAAVHATDARLAAALPS